MAVGNVAATDMPLAASFNAALLSALLWLKTNRARWAVAAGVFLGLSLLAKGLVGAVLFLPLLWFARKRLRGLALLIAVCAAVALPWYAAVTARNGMEFVRVFFLCNINWAASLAPDLQHVQPFWFYVPVLLGLLFPWDAAARAVAALYVQSAARADIRRRSGVRLRPFSRPRSTSSPATCCRCCQRFALCWRARSQRQARRSARWPAAAC